MALPTDGPKTLNGLIIEYLEMIPDAGTTVLLDRHPIDILLIKENMVKTVRIHPALAVPHADAGRLPHA
jgi:Mg2+/Co2+ transporter CorB